MPPKFSPAGHRSGRTGARNLNPTDFVLRQYLLPIPITDETINGQPVADSMTERWADEAETGYDVEKLRKRGRPSLGAGTGAVVHVRMDAQLLEALNARAEQERISQSEAIREAVRAWTQAREGT